MNRSLVLLYGVVSYVAFFVAFCYAIGFTGNFLVPKGIDDGPQTSTGVALVVNLLVLSLFAVQHSVMARPAFKRWWTRICPHAIERSTFVLLTSLILGLIYWQWRPMTGVVWDFQSGALRGLLWILFAWGWFQVFYSTILIDHFDLFGLRQTWLYFQGREYTHPEFQMVSLYKYVRHPLLLGFIIAFWATPTMTTGHLLFAAVTTAYMLIAIQIEEHDLMTLHGADYQRYRQTVSMIVPLPRRGNSS